MKIVVNNTEFNYDLGVRLLKLKNGDNCPFDELSDIWNDVIPLTFKEIAQFENLEQRRVGVNCLGLDRLVSEVNPTLVNRETISKITHWVNEDGSITEHKFDDTYELYCVKGEVFSKGLNSWVRMNDCYYVKCKDTSTDRDYLIWVDVRDVYNTNNTKHWDFEPNKVTAIQSIAWTIQTDIKIGGIKEILRQGDCILFKPKRNAKIGNVRHLTEKEYRRLMVAES
jgi:hypothetical protein